MKWVFRFILGLVAVIVLAYVGLLIARPSRTDETRDLFQGARYSRRALNSPRPLMLHVVEVDLSAPGIDFLVTPGDETNELAEMTARTTGAFVEEFGLQVAINGSFFNPFHASTPWDYYPKSGDPVNARGLAISNGETYSTDFARFPTLCIFAGQATILRGGCPAGTMQAISGNQYLVRDGRSLTSSRDVFYQPRTALAVDATGQTLWLVVVDGRQRFYSEGVALTELAAILADLGAETAINLDGGGSTTLVVTEAGRARTLNSPIHTRIPMRQRPIANHFGLYAFE